MLPTFIRIKNTFINPNLISSIVVTPAMPLGVPSDLQFKIDINKKKVEQRTAFVVDVTILTEPGEYFNNTFRFFNEDARTFLQALKFDTQGEDFSPPLDYDTVSNAAYKDDMDRLKRGELISETPRGGGDEYPW